MNSLQTHAVEMPWYRHRWPWLLMMGPLFVVVAGSVTIWLALRSQDPLVVDDYYKQGKAINQDLRRARNAAALGMRVELAYQPSRERLQGRVEGEAQARSGDLRLRLVHSTQAGKDLSFVVRPDDTGNFSVKLPMLEMARWQVVVEDGAGLWRLSGAWQWPRDRGVGLGADVAVSSGRY